MKICLVTPDLVGPIQNGGIGTFCTHLLELIVEHEVTVLFTAEPEEAAAKDWRSLYEGPKLRLVTLFENMPRKQTINPPQDRFQQRSWAAYLWLKEQSFDVIHFQDWGANGFYPIRARKTGLAFPNTRMTVTVHSPSEWLREGLQEWPDDTLGHLRLDYAERYCVENADEVVFPSRHMLNWCRSMSWNPPAANRVLPCPFTEATPIEAQAKGPKDDPGHLIFFGRLETRKGLDLFARALENYLKKPDHGIHTVSFVGKEADIFGTGSRDYIRRLRLHKKGIRVQLHANLDMPAALKFLRESGGIVYIPSRVDNCPYAVIECIENGIPFYAAATGGIPDLVHADRLFEPTVAALTEAIQNRSHKLPPQGHPYRAEAVNRRWQESQHELAKTTMAAPDAETDPEQPCVSVCIPYFNQPRYLPQTLKALKQNLEIPFEVIIVNDGSTDLKAQEVFKELSEDPDYRDWRFIDLPENGGLGAARNRAAAEANGKYLIFHDSDNCATSDMIASFVRAMMTSAADCLTCGFISHHSLRDPLRKPKPGFIYRPLGNHRLLGLLDNVYGDANFCVRSEVFEATGGFTEERNTSAQDWEFLLRLSLEGYHIDVIPAELYWYRHLPGSMLRSIGRYPTHHHAIQSFLHRESPLAGQMLQQLAIPLFLEQQNLSKSWKRLPKAFQRQLRKPRQSANTGLLPRKLSWLERLAARMRGSYSL